MRAFRPQSAISFTGPGSLEQKLELLISKSGTFGGNYLLAANHLREAWFGLLFREGADVLIAGLHARLCMPVMITIAIAMPFNRIQEKIFSYLFRRITVYRKGALYDPSGRALSNSKYGPDVDFFVDNDIKVTDLNII